MAKRLSFNGTNIWPSMESTNVAAKVFRNASFNILAHILCLPIPFVIIPFMLHRIGVRGYGIWALLVTIAGFTQMGDVGVSNAIHKFVAEYAARKESDRLSQLINTSIVLYAGIGIAIAGILLLATGPIMRLLFRAPAEEGSKLRVLFMACVLIFSANLILSVFPSVLRGLQRYDISSILGLVEHYLDAIGIVVFLSLGWGLYGLVLNRGIMVLLTGTANLIIVRRLLPEMGFNPFAFSFTTARGMFRFGIKTIVPAIVAQVHFHLDKLLIAYFLQIELVAYYQIASRLMTRMRQFCWKIISPTFPAAAELHSLGDTEKLNALYLRSQKYNLMVCVFMYLTAFALAPLLVDVWLGPDYGKVALAIRILATGHFVMGLGLPSASILFGIGKPEYFMYSSLLGGAANVVLSVILVILYGFPGVIAGTAIAVGLNGVCLVVAFHKVADCPFRKLVRTVVVPAAAGTVACIVYRVMVSEGDRSLSVLAASGICGTAWYFLALLASGHIGTDEISLVAKTFQRQKGQAADKE